MTVFRSDENVRAGEVKVGAAAQRCRGLAKINCHLPCPPPGCEGRHTGAEAAKPGLRREVAALAVPMRNGVGSTGSAPPANVTSAACVSPQPAIGRIVRSASFVWSK